MFQNKIVNKYVQVKPISTLYDLMGNEEKRIVDEISKLHSDEEIDKCINQRKFNNKPLEGKLATVNYYVKIFDIELNKSQIELVKLVINYDYESALFYFEIIHNDKYIYTSLYDDEEIDKEYLKCIYTYQLIDFIKEGLRNEGIATSPIELLTLK